MAEREGLINRSDSPSVGEVGLNSGRNEDQPFGPGSSHQPGPIGPVEPGPMAHVARPAPGAHEPGPMPPLVPVLD